MLHKLFREDKMINNIVKICSLSWDDSGTIPVLRNISNEVINVDEFLFIPVNPVLELTLDDSGEKMVCDGILFFGDGTIEFHDKESEDAINWEYFDEKSIVKIETFLDKALQSKK